MATQAGAYGRVLKSNFGFQVYDQLRNSRNRLSKELSEKNRMIASLEGQIQERGGHLMAAHAAFSKLSQNLQDLQSLTSSAAATARYGVHSRVDQAASALIHSRAQQLQEVSLSHSHLGSHDVLPICAPHFTHSYAPACACRHSQQSLNSCSRMCQGRCPFHGTGWPAKCASWAALTIGAGELI